MLNQNLLLKKEPQQPSFGKILGYGKTLYLYRNYNPVMNDKILLVIRGKNEK